MTKDKTIKKWGICPVCEHRCSSGATIHYDCWKASFGWNAGELRDYVRINNALPAPKGFKVNT